MNWLEISLTLDGELAEAVADVLARYSYQGVSIESTAIEENPDDEGRPIGPVRVRAYLPADAPAALEATRTKIEQDLFYLGMIRPLPAPTYTFVADTDWEELWKSFYKPMRVGERLVIIPAWVYGQIDAPAPDGIPIVMNPGMAFGTGTHPTTQLCLAMLETYVKPGNRVFDIGCGSGILSVAAVKLGAGTVLAVDIDPQAERATRENAALNDVADKIEFRPGSLDLVLSAKRAGDDHSTIRLPDPSTSSEFPIVVANIFARVIINLLKDGLARTLAPGGALIVSGILVEQGDDVQAALHTAGLTIIEQRRSGDWIAVAATRV